ncbi:MAG: VWA domain-containing protein [Planctomycetes bacterium]|nr:VWA domain-containing protein [Planctomycetota bacterium]
MRNWARRLADAAPAFALLAAAALPRASADPGVVLYLVDQSASMGVEPGSLARAQRWLLEAECARRSAGERACVAVFGQGVELLLAPTDRSSIDFDALERALAEPRPQLASDTRLDARVEGLVAHLARDFRICEVRVIGDGELGAPAKLSAEGPPWTWSELRGPELDDAAVELEGFPEVVAPEAAFRIEVRYARRGALVRLPLVLELLQDGASIARRTIPPEAPARGELSFELRAPLHGATLVEVRRAGASDGAMVNDRSARTIAVEGTPRLVCVGELAWLGDGGRLAVQRVSPDGLAAALPTCDVVWIEDRDVAELPAAALARFVEEGGGLVISGLEQHLESGGYDRAPWRELLPVDAALDGGIEEVAVLLDASGSMDGLRFAEALLGLDGLRDRWGEALRVRASCFATELEGWRELKERGAVEARSAAQVFGAVQPRGATYLARALRAAFEDGSRAKRAVFVLTDGREEDPAIADPLESARGLAARAESSGIRVYALAIGAGAELPWLEALVGDGRLGAVRRVDGADAIAAALRAGATADRVVRTPTRAVGGEPLPSFPRELPVIAAHRLARLRAGAAAPFLTPAGHPLVALRAAAAGRVAWVATAIGAERPTSGIAELAESLARWCAGDALAARWEIGSGAEPRVRLRRSTAAGEETRGALSGVLESSEGGARPLELLRTGPRSYEAVVRAPRGGTLIVPGGPRRSLPDPLAAELSPFAPRWSFRGSAGRAATDRGAETHLPPSLWIGAGLVLLIGVAFRWGRSSSRRHS